MAQINEMGLAVSTNGRGSGEAGRTIVGVACRPQWHEIRVSGWGQGKVGVVRAWLGWDRIGRQWTGGA